jgi:cystathionine beta-synthase
MSKLYNDEWLRINGLMGTSTAQLRVRDVLRNGRREPSLPPIVMTRTTDRVGAAIDTLQLYGISQLPVSEAPEGDAIDAIVGSVSEKSLLDRAYRDPTVVQRTVGEVMEKPLPTIDGPASLDSAFALLSGGAPAVVVVDDDRASGVVTRLDLLEYLAHRPRNS